VAFVGQTRTHGASAHCMHDHFTGVFFAPEVTGEILERQCPAGTSFSALQATLHASHPMHLVVSTTNAYWCFTAVLVAALMT